jgi:Flp pilus assembly protein TadG
MIRWLKKRQKGQSLVEFSLMLPVFLILVFGIIDFGMGLRAYITVAQATREGARFASIGNPGGGSGVCTSTTSGTAHAKACAAMGGLDATEATVNVTYPNGQVPGQSVRVAATYDYEYITPLSAVINFFSGGSMGDSVTVSASTDMRLE